MSPEHLADELAASMEGLPRGVYELLVIAIERLGDEMRIQPSELARRLAVAPRHMEIDPTDGTIVIRLEKNQE